jgi:hypothetical protein
MKRGKIRPVEELLARLEDFKKGENYHFHEVLPDAVGNCRTLPDATGGRRTRLGASTLQDTNP